MDVSDLKGTLEASKYHKPTLKQFSLENLRSPLCLKYASKGTAFKTGEDTFLVGDILTEELFHNNSFDSAFHWLYCPPSCKEDPNDAVLVGQFLRQVKWPDLDFKKMPLFKLLSEPFKGPVGGVVDSRTFVRPKKNVIRRSLVNHSETYLKDVTYPSASQISKGNVNITKINTPEPDANVIACKYQTAFEEKTKKYRLLNNTFDLSKRNKQSLCGNTVNNEKLNSTFNQDDGCRTENTKFDRFGHFGVNDFVSSPLCETVYLENVSCPLFDTTCGLSGENGDNEFTQCHALSKKLSRSYTIEKNEENVLQNNLPEVCPVNESFVSPPENGSFSPVKMSTPIREAKSMKGTFKQQSLEEVFNHSSDALHKNLTSDKVKNPNNCTWVVPNNSSLSKSDPLLLESVEGSNSEPNFFNHTPDQKQIMNDQIPQSNSTTALNHSGKDFNSTFTRSKGKTAKANATVVLENDDDNVSSASDSSYSSSNTHIRSLGDVHTLARQQEESLRMPLNLRGKYKSSGIIKSQEIYPVNSKVFSEENICQSASLENTNRLASSQMNINQTSRMKEPKLSCRGKFLKQPNATVRNHQEQNSTKTENNSGVKNLKQPSLTQKPSGIRPPAVNVTSRIPRFVTKIPTPNIRPTTNQSSNVDKSKWREGCY